MNCIEVQSYITEFFNHEMEADEELEMIHHLQNCPECMDELEIQYMILRGLRQLESEEDTFTYDFQKELKEDLSLRYEAATRLNKRQKFSVFVFVASCCICALAILLQQIL